MEGGILTYLFEKRKQDKKSLALLIDPDKSEDDDVLFDLLRSCSKHEVDFIFTGGSLISNGKLPDLISKAKSITDIPVVLFPGSNHHFSKYADAILFLSLISGRNPEYLIGQHVVAAPLLKDSGLEIIPTGYILVDGGLETSVSYLSNTKPIPRTKPDLVRATAIAGELLGLRIIYLESGSGAKYPVSREIITTVRKAIQIPLIVGGGLNSKEKAWEALASGADLLVIGNGVENNTSVLEEVSSSVKEWNALNIH